MTEAVFSDDEDNLAAAEYALGLLTGEERVRFEARVATEAKLQRDLHFWEDKLVGLGESVALITPPPRVYHAIQKRLFWASNGSSVEMVGLFESLYFWRGLSFASLTALAVLAGLYLATPVANQPESADLIAEIAGSTQPLKLAVYYDSKDASLRFNRVAGEPASGRDLELWLIHGSNPPISLGVLPVDIAGIIILPKDLKSQLNGSVLAISDEPRGGSPTGQPTGQVLATGTLLAL